MAPTNCFSKSFNPLNTLSFNTLTALNFKNDKIDTFLKFPTFGSIQVKSPIFYQPLPMLI